MSARQSPVPPPSETLPRPAQSAWLCSLQSLARGLLFAVVATGSAAGVHRFATSSARFALQDVHLTGLSRLSRAEVLDRVGATPGENLLSVDVDAAERSLVAHPWVRAARVYRRLPGVLRVEVVEFQADTLAQLGRCVFLVDSSGRAFKRWAANDPTDLPVLTGIDTVSLVRDRKQAQGLLRRGAAWLEAYYESDLAGEWSVQQLHFDEHRALTAYLGERAIPLYWGRLGPETQLFADGIDRVSAALRALSSEEGELAQGPVRLAQGSLTTQLQALDARATDRVVVRF